MYELRHLIDVIKYDKQVYIEEHKEIYDKIQVYTALNNRIIELKDEVVNQPDNKNLSFELEFCENEILRIRDEIDEFYKKNDTLEFEMDNSKKLMEFNFNELNQYVDLLEKYDEFNIEDSIINAMRESLKELEINVDEYINLTLKEK